MSFNQQNENEKKKKKKSKEEFFRKIHLKIDNFHRVEKDTLVYTKQGQYLLPWKWTEKYYVLNSSYCLISITFILLMQCFWYTCCKNYIIQLEEMQKYAKNRKSRLPWQWGCISKKIYMHFYSSLDRSQNRQSFRKIYFFSISSGF